MDTKANKKNCVNCGRPLVLKDGIRLCRLCNSEAFDTSNIFVTEFGPDEHIFIECPGATLYAPNTNEVTAGVKWHDERDPSQGHEIVNHPVYAPNHTKKRRIKKDAFGKIRRCRACQDFTVRMRRKEGVDFFIPSPKYPGRKKLKSVTYFTKAPR